MDCLAMLDHSIHNAGELKAWLDQHSVSRIRTLATDLHGQPIGKYLHRDKFESALPKAHAFSDLALGADLGGTPHLTFWHPFRTSMLGDIALKPDLSTLTLDAHQEGLAHVIGQFVQMDGEPITLCPRTQLIHLCKQLNARNLDLLTSMELEFFLLESSYDSIRASDYAGLMPRTLTSLQSIYTLRDAHRATPFMDAVTQTLEKMNIAWEAWSDENGTGQIELNLPPAPPVQMADTVMRVKQVIFETACRQGLAASFMPQIKPGHASGMHIHHSLLGSSGNGEASMTPLLMDTNQRYQLSRLASHWIGGLYQHLPASVSMLCPSINSYRRLRDFSAAPLRQSWGIDHKSAALRVLTPSPGAARIEHRLGSSDLNPYLALALIIASGLSGLDANAELPPPMSSTGWGSEPSATDLPSDMVLAAERLSSDTRLRHYLGEEDVKYWLKSRRHEWLSYQEQSSEADRSRPTLWEFERGFAKL